jgi:hypothetical protein
MNSEAALTITDSYNLYKRKWILNDFKIIRQVYEAIHAKMPI